MGHNYDAAKAHDARVKILFQGGIGLFDIAKLRASIREKLSKTKHDDFLLQSGPPLLNTLVVLEWPHQKINLLLYNRRKKNYVVKVLEK